jgi:S-adenosylmethionine decarboxylase
MLFLEDASEYGFQVKAHGRHITLDYTGFVVPAREGGELTMKLMRDAVREAGVREVHSKVVILGEEGESPPGFTAVCLVDESHVTAHCYSDRGWLAIDVFTCGSHPPERIATALHDKLVATVEGLRLMRGVKLDRFMHHAAEELGSLPLPPSVMMDGSDRSGRWVEEPVPGKQEIQDWRVGV